MAAQSEPPRTRRSALAGELAEIGGAWLVVGLEAIDELHAPDLAGAAKRWIVPFRASRIVHVWSLEDTLSRLRQLGLTSEPG